MSSYAEKYDFHDSFNIRAGILVVAEVGAVSFLSTLCLLFIVLRRLILEYLQYGALSPADENLHPVSFLFLGVIFMDSIQALGSLMSVRWAFNGKVTEGSYCSAQGALQTFGDSGVAWFTLFISILTCLQTMYPKAFSHSRAKYFAQGSICFTLIFLILIITIPATIIPHYYGNTGTWCWIAETSPSRRLRIPSEYMVLWLAAAASIISYIFIATRWLRKGVSDTDRRLISDAIKMGWYPLAYLIEIIPISVLRLLQFNNVSIPHGWIILAAIIFASSGAVNTFLWNFTGRRFGFSAAPYFDKRQGTFSSQSMLVSRPPEWFLNPTTSNDRPLSTPVHTIPFTERWISDYDTPR